MFSGPAFEEYPEFGDGVESAPHRYVKTETGVFHYSVNTPENPALLSPIRVDKIAFNKLEPIGEDTVTVVEHDYEMYGLRSPHGHFPLSNMGGLYLIDYEKTDVVTGKDVTEIIVDFIDSFQLSSASNDVDGIEILSYDAITTDGMLVGGREPSQDHLERYFVVERAEPNARKQRVLLSESMLKKLNEDGAIMKMSPVNSTRYS